MALARKAGRKTGKTDHAPLNLNNEYIAVAMEIKKGIKHTLPDHELCMRPGGWLTNTRQPESQR